MEKIGVGRNMRCHEADVTSEDGEHRGWENVILQPGSRVPCS